MSIENLNNFELIGNEAVDEYSDSDNISGDLFLNLEQYQGSIDVLLDLARNQKVDLEKISVVVLVDQYLEFMQKVIGSNLEIVAEYLVMAAWLVWLKSKLLLPSNEEEQEDVESLAKMLALRLKQLDYIRRFSEELWTKNKILDKDFFKRGGGEDFKTNLKIFYTAKWKDLLITYGAIRSRSEVKILKVESHALMAVEEAMSRLEHLLKNFKESFVGKNLFDLVPKNVKDSLLMRSSVASTFVATLELTKQGRIKLNQGSIFSNIMFEKGDDYDS